MQTVAIIDYGSGNLHSAAKAFERAAREGTASRILVTSRPEDVAAADRIVLPGVGAFADCKAGLAAIPGMIGTLEDTVRRRGRPFLGICVGMQLLATRGLEFEVTEGLGWIPGEVRAIAPADPALKIPHMGWNTLSCIRAGSHAEPLHTSAEPARHPLLQGIATGPDGLHAYFVHSFHLMAADRSMVIAETDYGGPVTAMVGHETVAGVQFHPEKSQTLGLRLIGNFLAWTP